MVIIALNIMDNSNIFSVTVDAPIVSVSSPKLDEISGRSSIHETAVRTEIVFSGSNAGRRRTAIEGMGLDGRQRG